MKIYSENIFENGRLLKDIHDCAHWGLKINISYKMSDEKIKVSTKCSLQTNIQIFGIKNSGKVENKQGWQQPKVAKLFEETEGQRDNKVNKNKPNWQSEI